jgi:hypothetical protein
VAHFELISTTTVGSGGAASIDVTGISSTYKMLWGLCTLKSDYVGTDVNVYLTLNGDTTSGNYFYDYYATAATAIMSAGKGFTSAGAYMGKTQTSHGSSQAGVFSQCQFWIPNYAGTSLYKNVMANTVSTQSITGTNYTYNYTSSHMWLSTSAINRVTLLSNNGSSNFVQYSDMQLYGLKE